MADTQTAPQPSGLQPIPALGGSIDEAQEALLSLEEPEKETPRAAMPKALPVCSRNHLETSFETDKFPIKLAPRAIGRTNIKMKAK